MGLRRNFQYPKGTEITLQFRIRLRPILPFLLQSVSPSGHSLLINVTPFLGLSPPLPSSIRLIFASHPSRSLARSLARSPSHRIRIGEERIYEWSDRE